MKQFTVLDGFNIFLALIILTMPFVFSYDIESCILSIAMGISLLSNVFITNKKVNIFITVACLSAILYSYFQIK